MLRIIAAWLKAKRGEWRILNVAALYSENRRRRDAALAYCNPTEQLRLLSADRREAAALLALIVEGGR